MSEINISDFDYDLPAARIAQHPVKERDRSRLLIYKDEKISGDLFINISDHIPSGSLLVLNNTRVIRARILFEKETGAVVEVLCLEPLFPVEYESSFGSREPVTWKCIIGNLKKWKNGKIIKPFTYKEREHLLEAEKIKPSGDAWQVRFTWDCSDISFGEIIESTGHIPLPPYIKREEEPEDSFRYQTVYSLVNGSVAAPTAGLHFTDNVLEAIRDKGTGFAEITLHVGAGTFKPVKTNTVSAHEMHCEHFIVSAETIERLLMSHGSIIPVGTTSVRTLESLYWLGIKSLSKVFNGNNELSLGQWEAYRSVNHVSVKESLEALLNMLKKRNMSHLYASTSMMIIPGYEFRMISGMITNFHQPKSTLLLLVSAWTGKAWKDIYRYALDNDFRFLSYGDCSLLI